LQLIDRDPFLSFPGVRFVPASLQGSFDRVGQGLRSRFVDRSGPRQETKESHAGVGVAARRLPAAVAHVQLFEYVDYDDVECKFLEYLQSEDCRIIKRALPP
jgi:hypothetical protein